MPFPVRHGAPLRCSLGRAPGRLLVTDARRTQIAGVPLARITDHVPQVNIVPFGVCVAGTPPRACVPQTPSSWHPGASAIVLAGIAVLDTASTLRCAMGGVIQPSPAVDEGVALP